MLTEPTDLDSLRWRDYRVSWSGGGNVVEENPTLVFDKVYVLEGDKISPMCEYFHILMMSIEGRGYRVNCRGGTTSVLSVWKGRGNDRVN